MTYRQQLRDPRWQKRRLEVMQRDGWRCVACGDSQSPLNVHHKRYLRGKPPWASPDADLETRCETCHEGTHGLRGVTIWWDDAVGGWMATDGARHVRLTTKRTSPHARAEAERRFAA